MGAAEEQTPSKPSKATTSAQETPPAMPSYPDWSGPMQAYYGNGATPPFFASTVAAPAPHPYMWAGQHPMMPPYGTPVPYPALYPPGGVYAHPNMAMTPNPAATAVETEGKNVDVKDQNSAKKSKGNSGAGNEKTAETGKATSGSGNEGASQSAESGSEGSSDGSDENNQQENSATKKGSFDLMLEDGANANAAQGSVPGKPVVAATNLNIGMDLWNTSAAAGVKMRPNTGAASAVAPAMVGRDGLMPDHQWIQDERELKRQKRKQSNRESARRSRLRKQAECEELQRKVESLNNENSSLREELKRLSAECEKLTSENNSIKEELTQTCGPDSIQSLGENNASGEADS